MSVYTKTPHDVFAPTDASGALRSVDNHDAEVLLTEVVRNIDGKAASADIDAEREARIAGDQQAMDAVAAEAQARQQAVAAVDAKADQAISMSSSGIRWTSNAVRVRATGNVNIASGLVNGTTLNGVTLATGDHVFLGSQTDAKQNGIYIVVASGAASRATFADSAAELAHIGFVIQAGAVGIGERWTLPLAADDITIGTTPLNFALTGIEPDYADELVDARQGEDTVGDNLTGIKNSVQALAKKTVRFFDDFATGLAEVGDDDLFSVAEADATLLRVYRKGGNNLFNPATTVVGQYVHNSGTIVTGVAGWGTTDYIPVTPGEQYTISANAGKQTGLSFFSARVTNASVPGSHNATAGTVTVTAPVGAAYMVVNLYSTSLPQPSEVMINEGATALPYEPYGASEEASAISGAVAKDILKVVTGRQLFDPSAQVDGQYVHNNGTIATGVAGWGTTDYIPVTPGKQYTISANAAKQTGLLFFSARVINASVPGSHNATAGTVTVTAPVGAAYMVVNLYSTSLPQPSEVMINEGATALPYEPYGRAYRVPADAIDPPIDASTAAVLHLDGPGMGTSYVEGRRSGVRNTFWAFPVPSLSSPYCRFLTLGVLVDGVDVRSWGDDVAPDHVFGTTLGGNHGYDIYRCTATAHGKTAADQGSVWTAGGVERVLVKVVDANTLLEARRGAAGSLTTGARTHVSGASNTASYTVSAAVEEQWYPPHNNYSIKVLVDGKEITERAGEWRYNDSVQFVETCDILARSEIINWWIANGGAAAGVTPQGEPSYTMTTTYHFDCDGQMSVYRDWIFLKATQLQDLMGLQVGYSAASLTYYVPGSEGFVHDGQAVNYALGEPSNRTVAGGLTSVFFDSSNLQANGEYGHRVLTGFANAVFAVGFLPVADAALDVRRSRVSNRAIEIRGNSNKLYFHVLNVGSGTAQPGDHYSAIGYRHVSRASPARTSLYTVRTQGAAYVYADWHDKAGLDRLPIPPDLTGRAFEVIDSRNCAVKTGILAGSLPVMVDADDDYGYLVLKAA